MLAVTYTDATSTAPSSVKIKGTLAGLSPGDGGWHVHSGYSCAQDAVGYAYEAGNRVSDAAGPAHYGDTSSDGGSDPWSGVTYTADASGVTHLDKTMTGCANLASAHPCPATPPRPPAPAPLCYCAQTHRSTRGAHSFSIDVVDVLPVFGHALVVHQQGTGTRIGCGVIGGAFGVSAASVTTCAPAPPPAPRPQRRLLCPTAPA